MIIRIEKDIDVRRRNAKKYFTHVFGYRVQQLVSVYDDIFNEGPDWWKRLDEVGKYYAHLAYWCLTGNVIGIPKAKEKK